jgi:periplasmic nitrate reductase NapD
MNVSGVLVHAKPNSCEILKQQLEQSCGIEVHAIGEDGKMVVTVESEVDSSLSEQVLDIYKLPDVLSVAMIYHHFDDVDSEALVS